MRKLGLEQLISSHKIEVERERLEKRRREDLKRKRLEEGEESWS